MFLRSFPPSSLSILNPRLAPANAVALIPAPRREESNTNNNYTILFSTKNPNKHLKIDRTQARLVLNQRFLMKYSSIIFCMCRMSRTEIENKP